MNMERLNPISDEEVAGLVSPQTRQDLAERIMTVPAGTAPRRGRRAMRLLVGVPIATAMATVAVVALSSGDPGQKVGPVPVGPVKAEALTFETRDGYLVVKVRDPVADPKRYRGEFAARGLNIDLELTPVAPRKTGTVVFMEDNGQIGVISAKGKCGVQVCHVGIKVPLNYKEYAKVIFGRAARPGERYNTGEGDSPGEGVGLPNVAGRSVADVVATLRKRHAKVEYRYEFRGSDKPYPNGIPADQVKPNWYVHDALPGSEGQVILFVGPEPSGRPAGRA